MKKTLWQRIKAAGPAAVITSAFIGPGTITSATTAGVRFGYALLWAVVFSGISLVIIMNMASRIALVGRKNIINASFDFFKDNQLWKLFIIGLFSLAIGLTAMGFEAGNIIGATSGLSDILGLSTPISALIIGLLCACAIVFTTPQIIEIIMKFFVAIMGIIFIITAVVVQPSIADILKGIIPTVPNGGIVNTISLVGTTIIAINLVFHSISSNEKWKSSEDLSDSYFDTNMNVSLGVVMTMAIIITSSAVLFGSGLEVNNPVVYSKSLEPVLGNVARIFGSLGLVFAGLSSAIATPYMTGVIFARLYKPRKISGENFGKIVALVSVVVGTVFAMFGKRPVSIIFFAQATSGVFLPIITILFIIAANSKSLGKYKNTLVSNILGLISCIVTLVLGMWTLYNVLF